MILSSAPASRSHRKITGHLANHTSLDKMPKMRNFEITKACRRPQIISKRPKSRSGGGIVLSPARVAFIHQQLALTPSSSLCDAGKTTTTTTTTTTTITTTTSPPEPITYSATSLPSPTTKTTVIKNHKSNPTPIPIPNTTLAAAFQTLLTRWHAPPNAAVAFLEHRHFREWNSHATSHHSPVLFRLIEDLVPINEQFDLMKAFLEADLAAHHLSNYIWAEWQAAWDDIRNCEESWEDAKELLEEKPIVANVAGPRFQAAARVVIAEQHLRICKARIEHTEMSPRPLTPCDDSCDFQQSRHNYCQQQQQHHCNRYFPHSHYSHRNAHNSHRHPLSSDNSPQKKYLDILRDFRHTHLTVNPSFYKYALEIVDFDTNQSSCVCVVAIADEYRHKYLQLINQYNGSRQKTSNDSDEVIFASPNDISRGTSNTYSMKNHLPTAHEALKTLIAKWKSLDSFNEYAQSLFLQDGHSISIFSPWSNGLNIPPPPSSQPPSPSPSPSPPPPSSPLLTQQNNLFSQIAITVSPTEQVNLTCALLTAFHALPPTPGFMPWSLTWLDLLLSSSSWDVFMRRFTDDTVERQLRRCMGSVGAKLVSDAIVLMVGERLLVQLKNSRGNCAGVTLRMHREHAVPITKNGGVVVDHRRLIRHGKKTAKRLQDYMSILRTFKQRGVTVDVIWYTYLYSFR